MTMFKAPFCGRMRMAELPGGADAFSTHFGTGKSTASYTLAIADIPSHSHVQRRNSGGVSGTNFDFVGTESNTPINSSVSTTDTGGGGGHSHALNSFNIKFADCIIAQKD